MILVIGGSGQVGSALAKSLLTRKMPFLQLSRGDLDLAHPEIFRENLEKTLAKHEEIRLIINAAAYTQVDRAETERDLCWAVNADAVGVLGQVAHRRELPVVHFSTDYVYSGEGGGPLAESAPLGPRNHYGAAKLAGEQQLRANHSTSLVLRISWIYDSVGTNFVRTMLRLMRERSELRIVSDQVGSPTWASSVAKAVTQLISDLDVTSPTGRERFSKVSGTYNFASAGYVSWYEFAKEIREWMKANRAQILKTQEIYPLTSAEYPTPAQRPLNSRMNTSLFQNTFHQTIPSWRESLMDCLGEINDL